MLWINESFVNWLEQLTNVCNMVSRGNYALNVEHLSYKPTFLRESLFETGGCLYIAPGCIFTLDPTTYLSDTVYSNMSTHIKTEGLNALHGSAHKIKTFR